MANLEKLNKTIEELENHSKQIKATSEALKEIKGLYQAIEKTNSNQDKVNRNVQAITINLKEMNKEIIDRYDVFSQKQLTLNGNLKQDLAQFQVSNKNAFEEMCSKIGDLNGIQRDINHQLIENVKLLSSENTKLYFDQKKNLENQLDLNLSEVKVISTKTRDTFSEEVHKMEEKIDGLQKKLFEQDIENKKYRTTIKILIGLTIGIGLINIVLRFI